MPKKRADGRYAKQVTVGYKPESGKPIKKTVYGKTIKELEKNYRDLMFLVDRNSIVDNKSITVKELYEEWYRITKEGKIRKSTQALYEYNFKNIMNSIGGMKVKDVKKYNIECLINDLLCRGITGKTKTILQTLKAVFNYAIEIDVIYKNPCNGLSIKYSPEERRALTENEKLLIDKALLNQRDMIFLLILRYTGMRRGEIYALHKSDISENSIHVCKTLCDNKGHPFIQDMTKTDAGDRQVPIFLKLLKPLNEYLETIDGYLFLNKNGNLMAISSQDLMFRRIRDSIGLGNDLTLHCFRHNFISECYTAGVDIKKVQAWVGHDDIRTTLNIYTKLSRRDIQDSSIMDEYYGSQTEVNLINRKLKTV